MERASAVLNAFTLGRPALRVSDVAKEVGLGLSITSRLLSTLESTQLVRRDPVSQLYELGPAVLTMAGVALNNDPVYRQSRPVAQRLAGELGLGANVAVLQGDHLFYLLNVEGHLAQKSFSLMGQRNPLHATGIGKCLLLGMTAEQRSHLLGDGPFTAYTRHTLTTSQALEENLATAAARGYTMELEELALSRACVAAPVRNHTGEVVAALSLSGALSAIALERREAELGSVVIEAADTISIGLGYLGPVHTPAGA